MATTDDKPPFTKLPKDVVPELYNVRLQPDLVSHVLLGSQTVAVKVKMPTNKVVVNAFDIEVTSASLEVKDTGKVHVPEIIHKTKEEKIEFIFNETLTPGDFLLKTEFKGHLNDQLRGFYRMKYTTPDGETRFGAGTHFEATGARRAYPCWDEPGLKAKFIFTLVVPKDRLALSNMPVEEEKILEDGSELKCVKFEVTPLMSTYLTAFVVGEYDCVENVTSNNIPVRVFTPVGKKEQGRFALEVATAALSYYEWYFDVPYGLPKLDLVTLSEFPIGAMENWGLVTYRETCLLVDPVTSASSTRQYVALIVTHELSHNWFGNLVTMDWWTDLWLKEGFATWIEYQCTDKLYPEFHIWMHFIKNDQSFALAADALCNSHPVEVEVGNPGEIDEIFDNISYAKGASLIRMLQSYIGDEAFRKGMTLYLRRHQFSNTTTCDMWAAMTEASGKEIRPLMESWTRQMGYPLLKVEEEVDNSTNVRRVTLTQEKFCSQAPADGQKPSAQWKVPYAITTSQSPRAPVVQGLMETESVTVTLPDCKPSHWIKVNPSQYMFYQVAYQPPTLQRLASALSNQNALTPEDKMGLLNDLLAQSLANYSKASDLLSLTKAFCHEENFAVCCKLVSIFSTLSPLVRQLTGGQTQAFDRFACDVFRPMAQRLGWEPTEGDSYSQKIVREQVLCRLGRHGDEKTKAEAFARFKAHCNKSKILSADLKSPVYQTVLTHGGKAEYDTLRELYDQEDSQEDKNRIARVLGMVGEESLVTATLDFALSDSVRNQDSVWVLLGTMATLKGQELTWRFVQDKWSELHRRYGSSTLMARLVKVVMDGVACPKTEAEMRDFFSQHPVESAKRAIQQGLERIAANVAFLKLQGDDLLQYLGQETTVNSAS